MNKYWTQRATLTRTATLGIALLLGHDDLVKKCHVMTSTLEAPDEIADAFGDIMTDLIIKVDPTEGVHINEARAQAKEDLKDDENLIPHCDDCKNSPSRPVDYWDHVAFIDEKSMESAAHLVITGMKPEDDSLQTLKTIGILGQWKHSLLKLDEAFEPVPKDATVK